MACAFGSNVEPLLLMSLAADGGQAQAAPPVEISPAAQASQVTPSAFREEPAWIYEGAMLFTTEISCNYMDSPYKGD